MKIVKTVWISILIFFVGCSRKSELYKIQVDVASKKEGGVSWDFLGGSPDINVFIDHTSLGLSQSCRDSYRCNYAFKSIKDKWYIEVYDVDIDSDDLIGKGECEEGEVCQLGRAKVMIRD